MVETVFLSGTLCVVVCPPLAFVGILVSGLEQHYVIERKAQLTMTVMASLVYIPHIGRQEIKNFVDIARILFTQLLPLVQR